MKITPALLLLTSLMSGCVREESIPLREFTGRDRKYFPDFLEEYFEAARKFQNRFPTIESAATDVRVIQVKRLSEESAPGFNESNLAWSADGVFLSYELVDGRHRKIQVKSLKGEYQRDLLVMPRARNDFLDGLVTQNVHSYNAGLSWSHDSTRYAFMSNGGHGIYSIFVGGVGIKEEPIAASTSKNGYANWSPSGNQLTFVSSRTGSGDIYLYKFRDEQLLRLTSTDKVDLFPVWSPKGDAIIFSSGDQDNHDIMIVKKLHDKWQSPQKITTWEEDDLRPTYSPSGNLIAFYASDPGSGGQRWNLHVVAAEDNGLDSEVLRNRVVARDVVVDLNTGPAWSPDSRKLFYVKQEPERHNPIYAYDLYSGRRYRLNTGTAMNRDILMSSLGVLSFRAQVGAWDRVFLALTNQGDQLQGSLPPNSKIHYGRL